MSMTLQLHDKSIIFPDFEINGIVFRGFDEIA